MDEFTPSQTFSTVSRLWWLIVLSTLLGKRRAYLFHRLNPPVYQATSSLNVTIDLTELQILTDIPKDKLQYNEDLALSVTDQAFRSLDAYQAVLTRCLAQELPIPDVHTLYANQRWSAATPLAAPLPPHRPQVAQAVAGIWAEVAYENMVTWQSTGQIPAYLIIKPPTPAALPEEPVLYDQYRLLLAGGLIGLILGILLTDFLARKPYASPPLPDRE